MKHPRRNWWGTGTLVAAAVGFLFFTFQPWWPGSAIHLWRAFFDAALVGALADWFAVTALFRRPLGLPLPHTDLLVRQKDQLVQAVPEFLSTFLGADTLHPTLKAVDWARMLMDRVDPQTLDQWARQGREALERLPGRSTWEEKAVGVGAELIRNELVKRKETLVSPLTEMIKKSAGWKGMFVSKDSVSDALDGLSGELLAVRDRLDHPLRAPLTAALHQAWPSILERWKPSELTKNLWESLRSDHAFRQEFNDRVGQALVALWEKSDVTKVLLTGLTHLLSQTDARGLARRVESAVGNDLQYIRVNGALVGGLAGLVLALVFG